MFAFFASADAFAGLLVVLGLVLAVLWIFLPLFLLRRLDALEKQAMAANALAESLILHIATMNANLVAYGQSVEKRLDAIASGQQKTPGQSSAGVRYEIGGE